MPRHILCVLLFFTLFRGNLTLAAPHRNVVVIMADDLGFHDLSCYGHPQISTPVLDQLATDGVRLTSFYAGATVCTPSRMALLTGCYPSRLGWKKGVVGHIMRPGTGLPPAAVTMAEIFQKNGYATGIFGKWHLGDPRPFRPHRQGFDTAYYINKSNNQTSELWRGDDIIEKPFSNRHLSEKFTQAAIDFIDRHHDRPFLLYVPYTAPHFPIEPHPNWQGKSKFGAFGDVVEEMDFRIGQILECLEQHQLSKQTLVVFLSDNGPEPLTKASKSLPYRGKKWSALEGGTRVPCIIRLPKVLPRGRTTDAMVAAIDLLPTLCHACDIELKDISLPLPIDGINVWDSLASDSETHPRRDLLYWHGSDGLHAIRLNHWKLFFDRKSTGLEGSGPALFDLRSDIREQKDVSRQHPQVVERLTAIASRKRSELVNSTLQLGQ